MKSSANYKLEKNWKNINYWYAYLILKSVVNYKLKNLSYLYIIHIFARYDYNKKMRMLYFFNNNFHLLHAVQQLQCGGLVWQDGCVLLPLG